MLLDDAVIADEETIAAAPPQVTEVYVYGCMDVW